MKILNANRIEGYGDTDPQVFVDQSNRIAEQVKRCADDIERLRSDKEHLKHCDGRTYFTGPGAYWVKCEDRAHE